MLGFKSTTWHPGLDESEHLVLVPQNILTIIQRIEKRHIPGFCGLYALLSEAAHPNYTGMMEQSTRWTLMPQPPNSTTDPLNATSP